MTRFPPPASETTHSHGMMVSPFSLWKRCVTVDNTLLPEGQDALLVTYQVTLPETKATPEGLDKLARKIAIGQTIGTDKPHEVDSLKAFTAWPISTARIDHPETPAGHKTAQLRIAYPLQTIHSDLGTMLSVIFGKISMAGQIRLTDITVPQALAQRFGGPRYGTAGIRRLTEVPEGPLLMSIFKPCLGLPPQTLGEMFYTQSLGGVHLVKDDEILSDPDFDSARRRLEACLKGQERALKAGGRRVLYAINLTGPAETLLERARVLVQDGAGALLFNYLCYGLPMLNALRQDPQITVPLVAHPALAGAFYGSPLHGIAPNVLFGILPRLAGADLVLFPSPYGSVALPFEDAMAVADSLRKPSSGLYPVLPVPSAGITADMAAGILADFGPDVVANAGTGIHDHPEGSLAGARTFAQALGLDQTPLIQGVSS